MDKVICITTTDGTLILNDSDEAIDHLDSLEKEGVEAKTCIRKRKAFEDFLNCVSEKIPDPRAPVVKLKQKKKPGRITEIVKNPVRGRNVYAVLLRAKKEMTIKELAAETGLSDQSVYNNTKKLLKQGKIAGVSGKIQKFKLAGDRVECELRDGEDISIEQCNPIDDHPCLECILKV